MITQIRLVNCQSWEDCTINLSTDKINVVAAPNGTGKSVIFKILKITACPDIHGREKQKKLIRWGCEYATALYACDDGSVSFVRIYPNKVLYGYKPAGVSEWIRTAYPTREMLNSLGLIANTRESFIANIIDTDQSLLLVDSKLKSNVDLISFMVTNEHLDLLAQHTASLSKEFRTYEVNIDSRLQYVRGLVQDLTYVDTLAMEREIAASRAALDVYRGLSGVYKRLLSLEKVMQYSKDYVALFSLLDAVQSLENVDFSRLQLPTAPPSMDYVDVLNALESCRLSDLQVVGRCLDTSLVDTLQSLESIQLEDLLVLGNADTEDALCLCGILETLEWVKNRMSGLQVAMHLYPTAVQSEEQYDRAHSLLQMVDSLASAQEQLGTVRESSKTATSALESIATVKEALHDNCEVLVCPIYKEVAYDGENCIPYSD